LLYRQLSKTRWGSHCQFSSITVPLSAIFSRLLWSKWWFLC